MAEYTDEEIALMIKTATTGMLTEEDFNKKLTAEVDRRVQSGIDKGIETAKAKILADANLTAEDKAKKEFEDKLLDLTNREVAVKKQANLLSAKNKLSDALIPQEHYNEFLDVMVLDDENTTIENVNKFINMFNGTKTALENKFKAELSNIPPPNQGSGGDTMTKDKFAKMGYSEKLAFKEKDPDTYKQYMK